MIQWALSSHTADSLPRVRAMQSRLVTDEQLEEIVQLPNVPQVTAYLKRTPEYQNIWSGLDENDLHRGR